MDRSLSQILHQAAERYPERPAILQEGEAVSYARLAERADRIAALLTERGLGGRRLGILLPNLPSLPLALYGILRTGGSALLLNPMNSPRETEEYLRDAEVDAVFTTTPLVALLPQGACALLADELPDALRVVSEAEDALLRLDDAPPSPPLPVGGEREAAVIYTAASRGWSRGAVLSHRNLIANLEATVEAMRLTPEDRVVGSLPYIHAFGLTVGLNAALAAGAALAPVERFNPMKMLDLFAELRPTIFAGVPAMYVAMIAAAERRGAPEHALRVALCGGAPLPRAVAERWEALFGIPLRQGYGLTEAAPVCLFNRVDRPNHPSTLGYPFPGVEVTIRNPRGEELPRGEVGEICVRGANVFSGYLGEGGRQERDFFGDSLRTGDLGSQDEEGVVRFRGVLKPMFTRNGFNVYPLEVERVLETDERIAHADVYALPEPARENEVILSIRTVPGAVLTEDDVRELCRARLAAYKQPTRVLLNG